MIPLHFVWPRAVADLFPSPRWLQFPYMHWNAVSTYPSYSARHRWLHFYLRSISSVLVPFLPASAILCFCIQSTSLNMYRIFSAAALHSPRLLFTPPCIRTRSFSFRRRVCHRILLLADLFACTAVPVCWLFLLPLFSLALVFIILLRAHFSEEAKIFRCRPLSLALPSKSKRLLRRKQKLPAI